MTDAPTLSFEEKRTIRKQIKRIGPIRFLEEVVDICFGEAERLRVRWGDPQLAKVWARRAELLHRIAQGLREEELTDPQPRGVKRKVPLIGYFRRDK